MPFDRDSVKNEFHKGVYKKGGSSVKENVHFFDSISKREIPLNIDLSNYYLVNLNSSMSIKK